MRGNVQEKLMTCASNNRTTNFMTLQFPRNQNNFGHLACFKLKYGQSWSWSYGSWIYNYLCNQCLSPLKLWVRIPLVYSIQHYVKSVSVTCNRLLVFSGCSCFLHQENWPPRYSWNIAESGIKQHSLTPEISTFGYTAFFCFNIFCWSVWLMDKIKLLKLMIFFKGFSNKSKVVILNSLSLKVALNTIASYPICLHSLTHPALHQSALSNLSRLITYTAYMSVCILIYNTLTINRFIVSCYFFFLKMRSRSKEAISKLEDLLSVVKPSEFKDNHLLVYKVCYLILNNLYIG